MSAIVESMPAAPAAPRSAIVSFVIRLFREKPFGAIAGLVFVLFLLCGIFADVLAPYGFNEIAPIERLKPPS